MTVKKREVLRDILNEYETLGSEMILGDDKVILKTDEHKEAIEVVMELIREEFSV